jgi:hypothetical protein
MNSDQLINLIQTIFKVFGGALAAKGIGDSSVWEGVGGAVIAIVTFLISHKWNATPTTITTNTIAPTTAGRQSGFALFELMMFTALAGVVVCVFVGCAAIQPGNDPIVVNVERTETVARDTFDMVLGIDNSQRGFYRTNAPAFHSFCEWLRQPQSVPDFNSPTAAMLTLPRASAMLISLDNVKLDYKSAKASSNDVFTALQTVTGAMAQANAWLNTGVATNSTPQ